MSLCLVKCNKAELAFGISSVRQLDNEQEGKGKYHILVTVVPYIDYKYHTLVEQQTTATKCPMGLLYTPKQS